MSNGEAWCHPTATVDAGAVLGRGTKVWHYCHVMAGARLGEDCVLGQNVFIASTVRCGRGCRIQNNVSLYDGVELADDVFVGPSVVFTNVRRPRAAFPRKDVYETTRVERGATLGANVTVRSGVTIGEGAFVAAGALVVRSVAPFTMVAGVPARPMGLICRCGESPERDSRCARCGRRYEPQGEGYRELSGDA